MVDAQGQSSVLEMYRCDHPGCNKLFQSRGALHTHQVSARSNRSARAPVLTSVACQLQYQGWHKRRPKEGQTFMVHQVQKRSNPNNMVETPRKRARREGTESKDHLYRRFKLCGVHWRKITCPAAHLSLIHI